MKKQKRMYNPKTKVFHGKAVGAVQVGSFNAFEKSNVLMACIETVRRTLDNAFLEGLADPEARKHLDAFVARMDRMTPEEDPFDLLHDFLFNFRQFDMFDWRRTGITTRSVKRRDGRLERGEISGEKEYSSRQHDVDEEWDGELDFSSSFRRLGKDVVFMPVFKSNEELEAYAEKRDLQIDLEGVLDESVIDPELMEFEENKYSALTIEEAVYFQIPCVRLSTKDENGSWAYYALLDDSGYGMLDGQYYVRIFQMRTGHIMPKGPDLRLNRATEKLAREIRAQKSATMH